MMADISKLMRTSDRTRATRQLAYPGLHGRVCSCTQCQPLGSSRGPAGPAITYLLLSPGHRGRCAKWIHSRLDLRQPVSACRNSLTSQSALVLDTKGGWHGCRRRRHLASCLCGLVYFNVYAATLVQCRMPPLREMLEASASRGLGRMDSATAAQGMTRTEETTQCKQATSAIKL